MAGLADRCESLKELGGPIPDEQSHVGKMHEPQDHHHETDFRAQKLERLDQTRRLGTVAQGQSDKADVDEVKTDEQQMIDRIGEGLLALKILHQKYAPVALQGLPDPVGNTEA